jgi:ElaA protein
MRWHWTPFADLSLTGLYTVLRLRQEIFVVEQDCPYLDADGDDVRCHHLLGWGEDGGLDAYLRVYPPGAYRSEIVIGRVLTAQRVRRQGLGRVLMLEGMARAFAQWGVGPIYLGGQAYLRDFYEGLGFTVSGPGYDEDGIPHFPMRRPSRALE